MPCSNVTGNHKLKFSFIREAKNLASTALQFHLTTIRMHGGFRNFLSWFFNELFPSRDQFLKFLNLQKKAVLVIGNALTHQDEDAQSSGDIVVIFLFPDVT